MERLTNADHSVETIVSRQIAALMTAQSALGLTFPSAYRDADWIRATWWGNDWITLIVAVPLLIAGSRLSHRGSVRGALVWCGTLGYAAYNYAYYLFGAALNAFFPFYVVLLVCSVIALILALARLKLDALAARCRATDRVRMVGAYFASIGIGLAAVWLAIWAAYVFAGRPTPVDPEAFKLVAALDLSVMVPLLVTGGVLLWRRHVWGYVIASIAGIQGSLYLMVLAANSVVFIRRGLVTAPGELPIWGTLAALTTVATLVLLGSVEGDALPDTARQAMVEHSC